MSRPSIDICKLKSSKLWTDLYRAKDPARVVNIEVWNNWKETITSNSVLARLPLKSVAKLIPLPCPDEMHDDTLSDHVSFLNILKHKLEVQKTIILSMAIVAIGYIGNKPRDYTTTSQSENSLMHVLDDRPIARLLTNDSWKSWQKTIAMSRLGEMKMGELAEYIGIMSAPELANVKVISLTKMTLSELKSKYSLTSLDIITMSLGTLSVIIKINIKHDCGESACSTDLATVILENYDTLKAMFAK